MPAEALYIENIFQPREGEIFTCKQRKWWAKKEKFFCRNSAIYLTKKPFIWES